MTHIKRSALVPRTAEAMFDLVNDIASYPKRFDWCTRAEVLERDAGSMIARLEVSTLGVRSQFTTRNVLHPHTRIEMTLVDGPFSAFNGAWTFRALGENGCKIGLELDFRISGKLVGSALAIGFRTVADHMVDDFVEAAMAT